MAGNDRYNCKLLWFAIVKCEINGNVQRNRPLSQTMNVLDARTSIVGVCACIRLNVMYLMFCYTYNVYIYMRNCQDPRIGTLIT